MRETNDERREVAKRLRVVDAKRIEEPDDMAQALAVCVTPETSPEFVDFPQTLFSRLADLIDPPTCHVVKKAVPTYYGREQYIGLLCCSRCDAVLAEKRWYCQHYPRIDALFCPRCGARIMREGGDRL